MDKENIRIETITESNAAYVKVGKKFYKVHNDVYKMIKLLLKENRRLKGKKGVKNVRFEA